MSRRNNWGDTYFKSFCPRRIPRTRAGIRRLIYGICKIDTISGEEGNRDNSAQKEKEDTRTAQLLRRKVSIGKVHDEWWSGHACCDSGQTGKKSCQDIIAVTLAEMMMGKLHSQ